jgi:YD repeat-containing protein
VPTSATDAATGESVTYTHDAIGNLIGINSSMAANDWTYAFDAFSRLTCAVQGSTCLAWSEDGTNYLPDIYDNETEFSTDSLRLRGRKDSPGCGAGGSVCQSTALRSCKPQPVRSSTHRAAALAKSIGISAKDTNVQQAMRLDVPS